ncbi:MAG TPA: FAD-dependent oxidoreductase [Polyangiaceae bacterium]|jgi:NADPH-dependent glutamate synthase beta subunit-like oxidoreductase/NAD(P)H-flavin reductase
MTDPTRDLPASPTMPLGVGGFTYADLYEPSKLRELHDLFDRWFAAESPEHHARFDAYRACKGQGMTAVARSEALLAGAPYVGHFLAKLFGVETEAQHFREMVRRNDPLWRFKKDFIKKRVLRDGAGKSWSRGRDEAEAIAKAALQAMTPAPVGGTTDEERTLATAALPLFEIDEVARKAAKAGGAQWTDELRERARKVRAALLPLAADAVAGEDDAALGLTIAFALDALEAWLAARRVDPHDPMRRWASMHVARNLDWTHLVEVVRPEPAMPELFVGPEHERRQRLGFSLTDRRMRRREVEAEIEYCMLCHDRDKDSCSKGLLDAKTGEVKKNPLGVALDGCPLEEKISEMHAMRQAGELVAAMALITIDNPMCPGTGHRICNDCMKACIFQKQEPVNIPQVETRVLTETLALPWGLEIYQLLTRWNPLHVDRPYMRPYNGRNVLVVGLGPAGYTLAHHLACEGFGVVAVDGLKVEPIDVALVGTHGLAPRPVKVASALYGELQERRLLGFGGVSEYGITVRWDKNFLTIVYLTLARNRHIKFFGGVRFGGTITLEDAWGLGFDHVAISAGAGRPTIIDMKNNLSRGIRKASDFLMALQLTGAYKHTSIANLQVSLPAVVIGGGLTAIDTATELLAYYQVQLEKELERYELLLRSGHSESDVRRMFDDEEWGTLERHLAHARELRHEKAQAASEGREPQVQRLLDAWGGVTLVYRKGLEDSPAYRLNHEEVMKSLEEGVRYVEHMSPLEAVLDDKSHVKAVRFQRQDGTTIDLPARTLCVAAGTSPNVIYEKEYPGTFELDARKQYFKNHAATVDADGRVTLAPCKPGEGFFTSYLQDNHTVSFYGDNHPHYAGSVVRAMASAKDGYPHVVRLFPQALDPAGQPARDEKLRVLFERLDHELVARVHQVNRLTRNIVEIVVHAPMAARKFQPGQFYRLQNFEAFAPVLQVDRDGKGVPLLHAEVRLAMEGLALTGAWVDVEKGLLGTIVLEMGGSSRLCAALEPNEPIILMGPTGQPTEIAQKETVLLCGGGLGNAVLFSIARAFKLLGGKVLYFAGYRRGEDLFKREDIERWTDQVVWCTDGGSAIEPHRPQDRTFRGNLVQAMTAYGTGQLGGAPAIPLREVKRIIAIGSDGMMNAVREARHAVLAPLLDPKHLAIGSINSPMQCMMKEVCAQCLQKLRDPHTGKERVVFTCFNQDQELDAVDFRNLHDRLRANSMQEKLSNAWLDELLRAHPEVIRV